MREVLPAAEVPEGGCVTAAGGRVLVTRVDGRVRAYDNRCPHAGAALAGGLVRDGVLTCPGHFRRYALADGSSLGDGAPLARVPVAVVDGDLLVDVPEPDDTPISERLAAHARDWQRDDAREPS